VPAFIRVFGADDSVAEKVARWEMACLSTTERWERLYRRLMPNPKPRFLTAKGLVSCPADLIGTFIGKAGASIRALERELSARPELRKTRSVRRHFDDRVVITVNKDQTISFVAPAVHAADVEASIRGRILALSARRQSAFRAYCERQIRRAEVGERSRRRAGKSDASCGYEDVKEQARTALHNEARQRARLQVHRKHPQPQAICLYDDEEEHADVLAVRRSARKSVRSQRSLTARGGVQQNSASPPSPPKASGDEEKARRREQFEARKTDKKARACVAARKAERRPLCIRAHSTCSMNWHHMHACICAALGD
jgi:hypothetical protein